MRSAAQAARRFKRATMNYSLRNDLSFCTAGDRVIFLDLRKDRYFALGADAQAIFDKLIRRADLNPADSPKLADLVKAGLLNCDNEGSAVQPCLRPPQPVASALETPPARSSFADLLLVLWALLAASTALKFRSLLDVVQIIERRKAHAARNKAGASPEDPAALAALAAPAGLAGALQRTKLTSIACCIPSP